MPVSDLVDALRLEQTGPHTYRAQNFEMGERGVVFGGQLIAQLIAAGATVDETKRVKSAHAVFARPVMVADPVELRVDVLQNGRTFGSATASLWQDGKERSRATILLTADEPDMIRHSSSMPEVASADETSPMGANPDVRVVGNIDILDADATGDPMIDVWFRRSGGVDGPGAQSIEQGLLAHSSASFLIGAAMRPHPGVGQSAAHAAFSTGIIAHTISFHEPIDLSEWHLLRSRSTYAGRGRAYGAGEIFASGQLVASFSQESMVRHFPEGVSPEGQESTVL
jgi:acyl-CoA thioesterase-2